jgi:hypothetical protein
VSLGRGPLHKIEAGVGAYAGYFVAQFSEQIELWHIVDVGGIALDTVRKIPSHAWKFTTFQIHISGIYLHFRR